MDFGFTNSGLRSRPPSSSSSALGGLFGQGKRKACRIRDRGHGLGRWLRMHRAGLVFGLLSLILIAGAVPSVINGDQKYSDAKCPNWLLPMTALWALGRGFVGYNAHIELGITCWRGWHRRKATEGFAAFWQKDSVEIAIPAGRAVPCVFIGLRSPLPFRSLPYGKSLAGRP